jgi:hypothetical protein
MVSRRVVYSGENMKRLLVALVLALLPSMPLQAQTAAPDSQLCRSQLDLLKAGGKLSGEEAAVFEKQCDCLESRERDDEANTASCAEQS